MVSKAAENCCFSKLSHIKSVATCYHTVRIIDSSLFLYLYFLGSKSATVFEMLTFHNIKWFVPKELVAKSGKEFVF